MGGVGAIPSLSLESHRGLKEEADLVQFFEKVESLSHHRGWCVVRDGAVEGR